MLRKVIHCIDFDGRPQDEVCYFNLTKSEVLELDLEQNGGMSSMLKSLIETRDSATIMQIIKKIILRSYGEKSTDGRRFVKSEEISENFRQTMAYDELFMELLQDSKALEDFMMGVMPDVGMSREELHALAEKQLIES